MRKIMLRLMTAILAITATSSEACRVSRNAEQYLTQGYDDRIISAVALVQISSASYTSKPFADAHPWEANASVSRVLRGSYKPKTLHFSRGWGSAACDDGHPLPKIGTRWVIYFWTNRDGTLEIWKSYPVITANKYDPKLKGRIR